jgi:hypothetical protein
VSKSYSLITFHFDVADHRIPAETLKLCASAVQIITSVINDELFGGSLELSVEVESPETGGFLLNVVVGCTGLLFTAVVSPYVSAVAINLVGVTPEQFADSVGDQFRTYVSSAFDPGNTDDQKCLDAAKSVSEATRWFMSTSNDQLIQSGLPLEGFIGAFEIKRDFYKSCEKISGLNGLGFSEKYDFPIRPSDFVRLQRVPKAEEPEDGNWLTGLGFLRITSPNWDKGDATRTWRGKDNAGILRTFHILDDNFWAHVQTGRLPVSTTDVMEVQWIYQKSTRVDMKKIRVVSVLKYNGQDISRRKRPEELKAIAKSERNLVSTTSGLFDNL